MRSFVAVAMTICTASVGAQEVLITPSYAVTIIGCGEGVIACDDAKYIGVSRKTGATLQLKGSTQHTKTPDGTPNRFLGYEFRSGKTVYTVSMEGLLIVKQGGKTLVSEQGKWAD